MESTERAFSVSANLRENVAFPSLLHSTPIPPVSKAIVALSYVCKCPVGKTEPNQKPRLPHGTKTNVRRLE